MLEFFACAGRQTDGWIKWGTFKGAFTNYEDIFTRKSNVKHSLAPPFYLHNL